MGSKFREKRKLPSEINFLVLNFVPKAFAINYVVPKLNFVGAKFRDSGNSHESHEIWHPRN